jgi:hypothetical protein
MPDPCQQCESIIAQQEQANFDAALAEIHAALDRLAPRIVELSETLTKCQKRLKQIERARRRAVWG